MSGRKGIVTTKLQAYMLLYNIWTCHMLVLVLNKHRDTCPGPCYHQCHQKGHPSHHDMYSTIAQHHQFHHTMCQKRTARAKKKFKSVTHIDSSSDKMPSFGPKYRIGNSLCVSIEECAVPPALFYVMCRTFRIILSDVLFLPHYST